MRKSITHIFIFVLLVFSILFQTSNSLKISAVEESYDVVYFGSKFCQVCIALDTSDDAFTRLENQGLTIKKYIIEDDPSYTKIFRNYQFTYDVPQTSASVPIIFVGETFFTGREAINEAIDNFSIRDIASTQSMPEIMVAPPSDFSLVYFVLLGFIDGVNPCAIAMLLIFISLLGFSNNKKILLRVSLTFIAAIFINYFLFGTILYRFFNQLQFLSIIVTVLPWVIIGLTGFLFVLNFYDFIVTLLQKYNLVKNQLPRGIQAFNRRLMKKFTEKMEENSKMMYVITFFIGTVISVTEFLCTGQAYLTAILHLIHFTDYMGRGIILLVIYNIIFVLPLIIITIIAMKTQSIIGISVFMREKLHWIKLFNALVFLAIMIYYLLFMI